MKKDQFTNFTYTKDSGEQSNRTVVVLSNPSKNVMTLDLSELTPEELESFKEDYAALRERQNFEFQELLIGYGLSNSFRQFKPEGISNEEEV